MESGVITDAQGTFTPNNEDNDTIEPPSQTSPIPEATQNQSQQNENEQSTNQNTEETQTSNEENDN